MTLDALIARFWAWMDLVATALLAVASGARGSTHGTLMENRDGTFTLAGGDAGAPPFRLETGPVPPAVVQALKGREAELRLQATRFLFRPLELPQQAGAFLDGIVRTQIDRLTPWRAEEAAYGWTPPVDAGSGRITLTIAATARPPVAALAATLAAAGARRVTVSTRATDGDEPVTVLSHSSAGIGGTTRLRHALAAGLAVALICALAASLAAQYVGGDLDAQREDLDRRIAVQRKALMAGNRDSGDATGLRALEQRKHDNPPVVLVLDWLTQALPDDTHLSELHVDGARVQLVGLSGDAPALVRHLEQSRHFTEATFVAPTTRAGDAPGERFQIETRIRAPEAAR